MYADVLRPFNSKDEEEMDLIAESEWPAALWLLTLWLNKNSMSSWIKIAKQPLLSKKHFTRLYTHIIPRYEISVDEFVQLYHKNLKKV